MRDLSDDSDASYNSDDGGSRTSKYACFAFMFDKEGCKKGGKCTYSHKNRVTTAYKRDKAKNDKKDKKEAKPPSRSERGGSSRDDSKADKKSNRRSTTRRSRSRSPSRSD